MKKWKLKRSELKTNLLNEKNLMEVIENVDVKKNKKKKNQEKFNALPIEAQNDLIKLEKKLILQEQIERTMAMSHHPDLRLVWTNYAIQFGYISFFSLVFPLAPLIGCILNIFDLMFSYFALTDHIKRKRCVEQGSIGIWAEIFMLMSFVSLFANLGIMVFADEGLIDFLKKIGVVAEFIDDKHILIYLAVAEHLIFLVKFLLSIMIIDMPRWIREEIEERNNKEEFHNENLKRELLQIKNRRKIQKNIKNFDGNILGHIKGYLNSNQSKTFKEDL